MTIEATALWGVIGSPETAISSRSMLFCVSLLLAGGDAMPPCLRFASALQAVCLAFTDSLDRGACRQAGSAVLSYAVPLLCVPVCPCESWRVSCVRPGCQSHTKPAPKLLQTLQPLYAPCRTSLPCLASPV